MGHTISDRPAKETSVDVSGSLKGRLGPAVMLVNVGNKQPLQTMGHRKSLTCCELKRRLLFDNSAHWPAHVRFR